MTVLLLLLRVVSIVRVHSWSSSSFSSSLLELEVTDDDDFYYYCETHLSTSCLVAATSERWNCESQARQEWQRHREKMCCWGDMKMRQERGFKKSKVQIQNEMRFPPADSLVKWLIRKNNATPPGVLLIGFQLGDRTENLLELERNGTLTIESLMECRRDMMSWIYWMNRRRWRWLIIV